MIKTQSYKTQSYKPIKRFFLLMINYGFKLEHTLPDTVSSSEHPVSMNQHTATCVGTTGGLQGTLNNRECISTLDTGWQCQIYHYYCSKVGH